MTPNLKNAQKDAQLRIKNEQKHVLLCPGNVPPRCYSISSKLPSTFSI